MTCLTTPASAPRHGARASRAGRPAAGFTLIEIMFAMVIFAIGILAMMLCVPAASKRVMSAGAQTRASSLASAMAEKLLTVPYGNTALTAGTHDDPANPHDVLYYTRWVVEDDQPRLLCKRITITVARRSVTAAPEARLVIVTPRSGG